MILDPSYDIHQEVEDYEEDIFYEDEDIYDYDYDDDDEWDDFEDD